MQNLIQVSFCWCVLDFWHLLVGVLSNHVLFSERFVCIFIGLHYHSRGHRIVERLLWAIVVRWWLCADSARFLYLFAFSFFRSFVREFLTFYLLRTTIQTCAFFAFLIPFITPSFVGSTLITHAATSVDRIPLPLLGISRWWSSSVSLFLSKLFSKLFSCFFLLVFCFILRFVVLFAVRFSL